MSYVQCYDVDFDLRGIGFYANLCPFLEIKNLYEETTILSVQEQEIK